MNVYLMKFRKKENFKILSNPFKYVVHGYIGGLVTVERILNGCCVGVMSNVCFANKGRTKPIEIAPL